MGYDYVITNSVPKNLRRVKSPLNTKKIVNNFFKVELKGLDFVRKIN